MLMSGYSALLGLGLLVSAPWWLTRMATTRRYREGLRERMGAVPARLRRAVAGKRVVWLHAVSVGEVLAVSRLVGELEAALNQIPMNQVTLNEAPANAAPHPMSLMPLTSSGEKAWIVVISTTTRAGQALARERFGAERVFYFPLDFAYAVRAYLRALRPALVVLAESELWPRLLRECARGEILVAVANARVSDRSFRRAGRVRRLWARTLRPVRLFLAQSEEDARRLLALGAPEGSVEVSGNLKYDVRAPQGSRIAQVIRAAAGDRPILVAGSTVAGERATAFYEDSSMIRAWERQLRAEGVLLVLAPRHPENFSAVYALAMEYPTLRATEMLNDPHQTLGSSCRLREGERRPVEIIVLDTIGDLAAVYGIADMAFVGGSLVRKGGHNPLEPAQFGVPVVMGPSFENFRDIVEMMRSANGICLVSDGEDLARTLNHLFRDPASAQAIGERGRLVFEGQSGATARTVQVLTKLLAPPTQPQRQQETMPA